MKFFSPKAQEINTQGYKFLFVDGCYETDKDAEIKALLNLVPSVISIKETIPNTLTRTSKSIIKKGVKNDRNK